MNFIVTGGCGFIGSHIVEKLSLYEFNRNYLNRMIDEKSPWIKF